jgi:hypothetical protein
MSGYWDSEIVGNMGDVIIVGADKTHDQEQRPALSCPYTP